jgi:glycosyltransferase involved in cell wall biosynthesis
VFNEKVEKPASKFYKKWGEEKGLKPCKKRVSPKKKKIGFLIDRIVGNSPMKVIFSLLKTLGENNRIKKDYELYVYSMCYAEKQVDNEEWVKKIEKLGVNVYSTCDEFKAYGVMYPHLEKALKLRDRIIEDKIDYLISGFGYDIPNFIFSNRSAPKQIFWSHGNCTTDIENIDLRISHFEQDCKEYEWKIFNVPMAEEFLVGSEEDRKKAEILKKSLLETYGKDTVFLGTIGRYVKIDSDEYIKVIAKIMKQNPNTIYLACGDGNVESIKEKLKKYDVDENRFVFTGMINPHVFGWIIDVWPDSFPLRGGHAVAEYLAKGSGIFLTNLKYHKNMNENDKKDIFEKKKNDKYYPFALNEEQYIEIANFFINSDNNRNKYASIRREEFFKSYKNYDILRFFNEIS